MAGVELFSEEGYRSDGRKQKEIRRINCKMGVFKQADGSAYFEQGETKVLAAVYGPHEVRGGRGRILHDRAVINCQYSMAVFSTAERKHRPRGDRKSIEMSQRLKQTFESAIQTHLHARSQIDIYIEILQADGGNISASINAASLALVDAGIRMKGLVCCCTAGNIEDTALVDLNHLEESQSSSQITVALLPLTEKVQMLSMNGRLHETRLEKVIECASEGCKEVYKTMKKALTDRELEEVTG